MLEFPIVGSILSFEQLLHPTLKTEFFNVLQPRKSLILVNGIFLLFDDGAGASLQFTSLSFTIAFKLEKKGSTNGHDKYPKFNLISSRCGAIFHGLTWKKFPDKRFRITAISKNP